MLDMPAAAWHNGNHGRRQGVAGQGEADMTTFDIITIVEPVKYMPSRKTTIYLDRDIGDEQYEAIVRDIESVGSVSRTIQSFDLPRD